MAHRSVPTPTLHSSAYVLRHWDSPPWSEPARAEGFLAACRLMEEGSGARLATDLRPPNRMTRQP